MSIVLMVIGVVLVAYLTLLVKMSPDVSATGEASKGEISNGEISNGEISNGEISNGEISNGKDSNGEILRKDGDIIRKEQLNKRH